MNLKSPYSLTCPSPLSGKSMSSPKSIGLGFPSAPTRGTPLVREEESGASQPSTKEARQAKNFAHSHPAKKHPSPVTSKEGKRQKLKKSLPADV